MSIDTRTDRLLHRAALVLVAVVVCGYIVLDGTRVLFSAWAGFRLAFAGFLAEGFPLYPPGNAPAVGNIYGPMTAVFYLPALAGATITADLLLAEALTVACVGGMLVVPCVLRARRMRGGLALGATVAVVGMCALLALPGLGHCLVQVHADGPCLFFAAASCLVWRGAERFGLGRSVASAVLLGLALWSKQTALPVMLGHAAVIVWRFGARAALVHACVCCAAAGALFVLLCALVGANIELAWFYLVTVPRKHPLLFEETAFALGRVATAILPAIALLWVLRTAWSRRDLEPERRSSATPALDVAMLAAAGLATLPSSALAMIKIGGYLNNAHSSYYLLLACCLSTLDRLGAHDRRPHVGPRALTTATLAALLLVSSDLGADFAEARNSLVGIDRNPHKLAYDYLVKHDDAYFPWSPLSVLQAQRRVYTSFDALRTLEQARIFVGPKAAAAFPERMKYVVLPYEGHGIHDTAYLIPRLFPGYALTMHAPAGLESFTVYAQSHATTAPTTPAATTARP